MVSNGVDVTSFHENMMQKDKKARVLDIWNIAKMMIRILRAWSEQDNIDIKILIIKSIKMNHTWYKQFPLPPAKIY